MCYFYDAAGNILELIARHTLNNESNNEFGAHSLLNVSEIGIAAADVAQQITALQDKISLNPYRWSGNPEFMPFGDEHGLFIVVQQGRYWFPNTGIRAEYLPVRALVEQGGQTVELSL